jgi:predicted transcriptional regulator
LASYSDFKGIGITNASHHLKRLIKSGLITKDTLSNTYLLTEDGEYAIITLFQFFARPTGIERMKMRTKNHNNKLEELWKQIEKYDKKFSELLSIFYEQTEKYNKN